MPMAELPPRLPSNQSRSCSIASQRVSHADEREPPANTSASYLEPPFVLTGQNQTV
jgi:hypothetical protein